MRVLFDSDVILDVVLERPAFYRNSALSMSKASKPGVQGLISAHAVPAVAYIASRTKAGKEVRRIIESLLSGLKVAAVTEAVIRRAVLSALHDFEDAITHSVAEECQASLIVTRNTRDFRRGTVRAVLPEIFLQI